MTLGLTLILVTIFVGLLALSMRTPIDREVRRAIKEESAATLIRAILDRPELQQPNLFHRAINILWSAHHRELALDLIEELAKHHQDENIAQYWLGQSLSVEPRLTRSRLSEGFIEAYFRPEVAARCGPAG
jgi:hypothetical protein|tara:strand:+ start:415 stop:807 length:393 start_codon:yes stop_codon:yes gene_type:complete